MEKSKLGIHVLLLAAGAWLLAFFGSYTIVLLFAGYILIAEENAWLKKQVARVLAVMLCFSLLGLALDVIPNIMDLLNRIWRLFDSYIESWNFLDNLLSLLDKILYLAEMVLFILSALLALKGKTIKLPVIDSFLERYGV